MKFKLTAIFIMVVSASVACASLKTSAPRPQIFTRRCVAQEADYGLNSASEISVVSTCTRKSGRRTDIKGFAKVTNVSGVLALKFTSGIAGFFWGFYQELRKSAIEFMTVTSAEHRSLVTMFRNFRIRSFKN